MRFLRRPASGPAVPGKAQRTGAEGDPTVSGEVAVRASARLPHSFSVTVSPGSPLEEFADPDINLAISSKDLSWH